MDAWIGFARGPLFRLALAVCVLGLAYRLGITIYQVVAAWRRAGDRTLPSSAVARSTLAWLLPLRLVRARPLYSAASFLFHAGIVLVPLFSIGHVTLWQEDLRVPWPVLTPLAADTLSVVAIVAAAGLLLGRMVSRLTRGLTKVQDVLVLLALFFVTASGFLAAHPALSPFDARLVLLAHLLLADLALVLTPTTKIAHCILFPFAQVTFELGWHFPAETGRHVAIALGKEDERV
jgi:nitrate reductase gamma subunit